jgi:hypothetical protein
MIQFEEKLASSAMPYSEAKSVADISLIDEQIKKLLMQQDTSILDVYNKFYFKNTSTILKSFLQNLEQLIKEKNIQEDKAVPIISSIFSTIYMQLKLLETLDIKKPTNEELIGLIAASTFSSLKRLTS